MQSEPVSSADSAGRVSRLWLIVAGVASCALLCAGIIALIAHNISSQHFWTDESTLVYTALAWPAPGAAPGGIAEAWKFTMTGFLDPGLFQMIARIWILNVGTSIEVLRIIPIFFFLVYVLALFALIRLLRAPWYLAAAGVAIMMFENITPYYAFEFRPYSGGLASSVVLLLITILFLRHTRVWVLALFIVVFLILASWQYTSVSLSIGMAALLVIGLLTAVSRRTRVLLSVALVLVLFWMPLLYVVSRGNPLVDPHKAMSYIDSTILRYQTPAQALPIIKTNLLSLTALPRTVFLILVPIAWWRRWLVSPFSRGFDTRRLISLLWVYVLVVTLMSALVAAMGFIPWVLGTRWSITEVGLIAISIAGLLGMLAQSTLMRRQVVKLAVSAICVVLAAGGAVRLWNYDRPGDIDYMTSLAPVLLAGEPKRAVVDYWIFTDVRYWMEFSGQYPEYYSEWVANTPHETQGFEAAAAADIQEFLASDDDRLMLRSESALVDSGVTLPPTVQIVRVPVEAIGKEDPMSAPIILVKESPTSSS